MKKSQVWVATRVIRIDNGGAQPGGRACTLKLTVSSERVDTVVLLPVLLLLIVRRSNFMALVADKITFAPGGLSFHPVELLLLKHGSVGEN
jgi:hypothetical protein